MLQIKNMLGGGKPEGLYVWKKSEIVSELKIFNNSVSTLPYNFYCGSAVVLNGEIHILGGGANSTFYKKHYKWDGSSWISVSTLPYTFNNGSAVVLNGEIHILGSDLSGTYTNHYKFDGSSWTSVSTLPYNFYRGSAVVLNNEIHILGSNYNSSVRKKHYKWDGSSWTSVSTLPYNFYYGSAVVLNGEIHILGSNFNSSVYTNHYKFDGSSWTSVSTLPYIFYGGSAVVLNNEIHILGGSNSSLPSYTAHYKFDGTSWTSVSILSYDFYNGSAVVLDNTIHILGSGNSSYYTVHYLVCGYNTTYTFLDYIVSDKETAYPDGGVKDGYWYKLYGKPYEIVTWADGTDEQIVAMINAADKGLINLADYWHAGDERQVTLSAMEATGVEESHVEQTVTFVLMNAGGKTLANATPSGRTECSFIVGMKNGLANGTTGETGYINSSLTSQGGWEACARRTWCNEVFRNAIPSTLRDIFKQHLNITANGSASSTIATTTDYFALPAEMEVFGSNTQANSTAEASLTQFEYYKTSANRIKKTGDSGSAATWWERSPRDSGSWSFCCTTSGGSADYNDASRTLLLSPFGVI